MALFGSLDSQASNDSSQSFGDTLGNYFQNRINQDLNGLGSNVTPQSTTINYNQDGTQDITHKLTAGPAVPQVVEQPSAPVQNPAVSAPVAPPITSVPTASQILTQPPGQAPAVPQATQQVPLPGQAQLQAQVPQAPVAPPTPGQAQIAQAPATQLQAPQAPVQPMIAGTPTSDVGTTPTEQAIKQQQQQPVDHTQNIIDWQDDPRKLSLIANDQRTPDQGGPTDAQKVIANKMLAEKYKDTSKKNKEEQDANDMIAKQDTVGIANAMKRKENEEGSYLKAYLFQRLGLTQLANQEQQKLGAGSTMEQVQMPDGKTALVRVRADGGISYGHDLETGKELDAKQLETISGQVANSKTAQTQAVHAYTTEKLRLQKLRDESVLNGASEAELIRDGLDDASIERQAKQLGADTLTAARNRFFNAQAPAGVPSVGGQTQANLAGSNRSALQITPNNKVAAADWAYDAGLPVISGHRNKAEQAALIDHYDANGQARTKEGRPVAEAGTSKHETYDAFDVDPKKMTPELATKAREAGFKNDIKDDPNHWYRETTAPGERTTTPEVANFVDNWQRRRENEPRAAWIARQKISGSEVDQLAHGLVDGSISTTDLTGRDANVRRYAEERALQLDPTWNAGHYKIVQNAVKNITDSNGKIGQTLINMGTAVDHAIDYKDVLNRIPATNVSSWNSFVQGVSKYGNAPEVKSKEALAQFLSGELVKAATGTGGGVAEREALEKKILQANTPAEVGAIIDTQLKLGHDRYNQIRARYKGVTKRDDFEDISPMSASASAEFKRLDKNDAAREWLRQNPNDPRAADVRKKLGL